MEKKKCGVFNKSVQVNNNRVSKRFTVISYYISFRTKQKKRDDTNGSTYLSNYSFVDLETIKMKKLRQKTLFNFYGICLLFVVVTLICNVKNVYTQTSKSNDSINQSFKIIPWISPRIHSEIHPGILSLISSVIFVDFSSNSKFSRDFFSEPPGFL